MSGALVYCCIYDLDLVVNMINHYGTTTIIRQCVKPGMWVRHKERAFQVSAVPEGKRVIYLNSLIEKTRIKDLTVEVYLDGRGEPLIARGWHASVLVFRYGRSRKV
ncbi:cell division protein FtsZ [Klebsiella sp. 2680]|uniref:cell division protein FtsZ n=1 Tax=Klebsiella sp. 2680 TaxID=2018037 RepID=UPI00163C322C|nr:cell division protein FtsZ [Klebsiella sp. 2680]